MQITAHNLVLQVGQTMAENSEIQHPCCAVQYGYSCMLEIKMRLTDWYRAPLQCSPFLLFFYWSLKARRRFETLTRTTLQCTSVPILSTSVPFRNLPWIKKNVYKGKKNGKIGLKTLFQFFLFILFLYLNKVVSQVSARAGFWDWKTEWQLPYLPLYNNRKAVF